MREGYLQAPPQVLSVAVPSMRRTTPADGEDLLRPVQPWGVQIGAFEIDLMAGESRSDTGIVRLQEQPFQILRMLLERNGAIVTRQEIREALWADGTVVDFEHSINTAIRKLRRTFGDSAKHARLIETVGRRGYRLRVPVRWLGQETQGDPQAGGNGLGAPLAPSVHDPIKRSTGTLRSPGIPGDTSRPEPQRTRSLRVSRQLIYRSPGKAAPSRVLPLQGGGLEHRLLRLEQLVLTAIRALWH